MNTISDSRTYLESVLERNDKLLFLWHEYEQSYRLESFDIETKEAEVVWEFILPDDWYEPCLKLESADNGQFDFRIVGQDAIIYKSTTDPLVIFLLRGYRPEATWRRAVMPLYSPRPSGKYAVIRC